MGRTIHYLVVDDGHNHVTDNEWQSIAELQEKYNTGHTWTCEQLSLERFSILPNWTAWEETGLGVKQVWDRIHVELDKPAGMQKLLDHSLIEVTRGGYRGKGYLMSGFTKVRDDESNAALVVKFLTEASMLAPGVRIKVHDEGDYLACPVVIHNGRMEPDKQEITSQIQYWRQRLAEGPADQMDFWTGLIARHRHFLNLDGSNADQSVFITQVIHR
jgi:hypothetical protein